jgi:hypothetical protein
LNIATQAQGASDRFVINPTTPIFYNNVGIGKIPSAHLDVSGHLNVSSNSYTTSITPLGNAQDLNTRTRTTGKLNQSSETGNTNPAVDRHSGCGSAPPSPDCRTVTVTVTHGDFRRRTGYGRARRPASWPQPGSGRPHCAGPG